MNEKVFVVQGHRGTGKTTWTKLLKKFAVVFDLDEEIEKQTQKNVSQLFSEGVFREVEKRVFKELCQKVQSLNSKSFISVGAGFKGEIPFPVIYLQRPSDSLGRVFLNRPRLLPHLSPFEEYQTLYHQREKFFSKKNDFVFTRLDYYKDLEDFDKVFLGELLPFHNGVLPLHFDSHLDPKKIDIFLNHKLKIGFGFFEICDEFLTEDQFKNLVLKIPIDKLRFRLLSVKNDFMRNFLIQSKKELSVDWPLEWGMEDPFLQKIQSKHKITYSLHDRNLNSLDSILKKLSCIKEGSVKLAIEILSFKELQQAHHWSLEGSYGERNRFFYPRLNGKWKWYRLLFNQPFYFIREQENAEIKDQPLMAESIRVFQITQGHPQKFAAVIGDPVEHSGTPYIQESFFKKYKMPVLKILMKEEEMTLENLNILKNMGLQFTAVTSPLKRKAFQILNKKSLPDGVQTVNTLLNKDENWIGFNTDIYGALSLKNRVSKFRSMAVWGGGGVMDSLKYAFKDLDLCFYSARTGKVTHGKSKSNPECVIWAVGRSRMSACQFPPLNWKPHTVFDLNYTEDSPGLEYALNVQAKYVSGWEWFEVQALEQRKIAEKMFERNL